MNIFILDKDPKLAAQMLCDKHIPKMIIESAQMLSTAHRMLDGKPEKRRSKSGKTIQTYYSTGQGQAHSHNMSANFTGDATSVLQPYLTVTYVIKT